MSPTIAAPGEVCGVVLAVDTVNRVLTLRADGRDVYLDLPPGCAIVLNGQPARLRLVQPQDRVRVCPRPGGVRIEVNPSRET